MSKIIKSTDKNKTVSAQVRNTALFGALSLLVFFLMLNFSDIAIEYMKKGLQLCAKTVIPSLFPFMVISELIVGSGVGIKLTRILAKPMRRVFGVSEAGASAFLLGAVCGFPLGAKTAVSMYDKGVISKQEMTRLLTFCNNPGSAFIISAVGVSLFDSQAVGILIYVCVILSALIIGAVGNLFFKKLPNVPQSRCEVCNSVDIGTFTYAIQSSAASMLTVCAYVAFFSSFVGCIGAIFSRLGLPKYIIANVFGIFELSSGVGMAAESANRFFAIILCSAFAGWSGISVHCQIMSICSGRGISFKPYFIAKAAQAVLCAAMTAMALKFVFPAEDQALAEVFMPRANPYVSYGGVLACIAFFICSIAPFAVNFVARVKIGAKKSKKIKKTLDKADFI